MVPRHSCSLRYGAKLMPLSLRLEGLNTLDIAHQPLWMPVNNNDQFKSNSVSGCVEILVPSKVSMKLQCDGKIVVPCSSDFSKCTKQPELVTPTWKHGAVMMQKHVAQASSPALGRLALIIQCMLFLGHLWLHYPNYPVGPFGVRSC